ncbi:hypothetical protein SAMN06265360_1563 [Haloechinothrix alba]|uniref:Uncharacterized protein n=1 Tax=Haloechinothrix alba TaxID=664784 RepID=A0A239ASU6_9PSEU|nr:hypothetical protein [Haloechinothrix alba]SNR98382.1 hypothetical protein SAMN06265360_1563 [Haloechinothrix alba]
MGAQRLGGGSGGLSGWDALLAAVRPGGGGGGHGGLFEGSHVAVIAHHGPGAFGCQGVAGDHRPSLGGDVEVVGAEPAGDGDVGAGEFGCDAIAVAAEGHQRLRRGDPGHHQRGRKRRCAAPRVLFRL